MRSFTTYIPENDKMRTAKTLEHMKEMVGAYYTRPAIIAFTRQLLHGVPERDKIAEVRRIFEFIRQNIRYTEDPINLETVVAPLLLLGYNANTKQVDMSKGILAGDCDCMSVLAATMARSVGIDTRFKAIRTPYKEGYSHVYPQFEVMPGKWVTGDITNKRAPFMWEFDQVSGNPMVLNLAGAQLSDWIEDISGWGKKVGGWITGASKAVEEIPNIPGYIEAGMQAKTAKEQMIEWVNNPATWVLIGTGCGVFIVMLMRRRRRGKWR